MTTPADRDRFDAYQARLEGATASAVAATEALREAITGTADALRLATRQPDPGHVRVLIDASSLGTPDAVKVRPTISDETAARILARAEQLTAESAGCDSCPLYFCPTSGDVECPHHGGFDVCCARPDLHQPMTP